MIQESTTDLKKGRTQFFVSLNWPSKPPVPGSNRPLRQPESRRVVGVLERGGLLIADPEGPALDFEVGSSLEQLQAASELFADAEIWKQYYSSTTEEKIY